MHLGTHLAFTSSEVINLEIPFLWKPYCKIGYKILLAEMKDVLFGDSHYKMTKKRCEEFFGDAENFVLD